MYAQQRAEEQLILQQADTPLDLLWLDRLYHFIQRVRHDMQQNRKTATRVRPSQLTNRHLRDIGIDKSIDFDGYPLGYRGFPSNRH